MRKTPVRPRGPRDARGVVRERIVTSARHSFATKGWAGTSLRAVAHEAGVDPALVHYYFAGKDALLDVCLEPPRGFLERVAGAQQTPIRARGRRLVEVLLETWEHRASADVLRSIVLTAAHEPIARDRLQSIFTAGLIGAVADRLTGDDRVRRAALVATQMVGVAILRFVWRIEPIASMDRDELVDSVGPTIQRYLNGRLERSE